MYNVPDGVLLEFFADHYCEELVVQLWQRSSPVFGLPSKKKTFAGQCAISLNKGLALPAAVSSSRTSFTWALNKKLRPRTSADTGVTPGSCLELQLTICPPAGFSRAPPERMLRVASFHREAALKRGGALGFATTLMLLVVVVVVLVLACAPAVVVAFTTM